MCGRVTRTITRVQESRSKATARRRSDNATELMLHSLPVCMKGRRNILAVICFFSRGFPKMVKFGVTAHNCVVFFYKGMVKKIGPRLRDPASCSFHGSRRASSCNLGFTYLTILLLNKALSPLFTLQYSRVFPPLGAGTGWDSQNLLEINLLCLVLYAMIYWIKLLIYLVLKFPWSVLYG